MSAMMIATTALIIASTAHNSGSGGGSNCQLLTEFGAVCIAIFLLMCTASGVSLGLAMTRHWASKWTDRWFFTSFLLLTFSIVPVTVAMIHDC